MSKCNDCENMICQGEDAQPCEKEDLGPCDKEYCYACHLFPCQEHYGPAME